MSKTAAVILAAGNATRMKSKKNKVLHKILDKTIIEYVVNAAKKAGVDDVCLVVGNDSGDDLKQLFGETVSYAVQQEKLGTGHAVMCAKDFISRTERVIVLCGDSPLVKPETLTRLLEGQADCTMTTAFVDDPAGYGRVERGGDGSPVKIVEHKDATDEEKLIHEINSAIYCFDSAALLDALGKIKNENTQREYYLTDTIGILIEEGKKVNSVTIADHTEGLGINSRLQLLEASKIMQMRINFAHINDGGTFVDIDTAYIGEDVLIGADTVIYPNVIIEGKTTIGEDCIIGANSQIISSNIESGAEITHSVIIDSRVKSDARVEPFLIYFKRDKGE